MWAGTTPDAPWWLALASEFSPAVFAATPVALLLAFAPPSRFLIGLGLFPVVLFGGIYGDRIIPHQRASAGSSGREITVYTQNVAQMYTRFESLDAQVARLQPDVFAVQELHPYIDDLRPVAEPNLPYRALEPRPSPSGVGIWSRFPILDAQVLQLTPEGHLSQRVRLNVDGTTLTVYAVHLNPPWPRGWTRKLSLEAFLQPVEATQRRIQVQSLLDDVRAETGPVIVVGDFNLTDRTWDYRQMRGVLTDAFASAGSGFGHTFPANSEWWPFRLNLPPVLRIDYVWVGPGLTVREMQVTDAMGSDHRGLVARIAID